MSDDVDVLARLVDVDDRAVIDVGCGNGWLVRALAQRGARATGVEISDEQLRVARREDPDGRYVVGRGEALPFGDGTVDVVVWMRALHHVPTGAMDGALAESARVLAPGGSVYVCEPVPDGDLYELVSIVDDEGEVRAAAQRAIADARSGPAGLAIVASEQYVVGSPIAGVDGLRRRIVGVDPERAPLFDARRAELEAAFARLGEPRGEDRWFEQEMQVDVLSRVG